MSKLLPVRLMPQLGEHFSGYLLRLAIANGRSSVKEILSTVGVKGSKANTHYPDDNLSLFASYLGRCPSEIQDSFAHSGILKQITMRSESRVYCGMEMHYPRICLTCVQSRSFIPAYAGVLPFTHCLEHQCALLHSCPQCQRPFEWEQELFESTCKGCGSRVEQEHSEPSGLPYYLHELLSRVGDAHSLNQYINDLLLALQRVLWPASVAFTTRERPPVEPRDWPRLLTMAHALLTDRTMISRWVATCAEKRAFAAPMGIAAVFLPLETLHKKLNLNWAIHGVERHYHKEALLPLLPELGGPHESRSGLDKQSKIYADYVSLAVMLGCKPSEVLVLLEAGAIQSVQGHRSMRDALFDISIIAAQLEQLNDDTGETVQGDHVIRIASTFGGHAGHILAGVLLNEIRIKPMPGRVSFLQGAMVGRHGLMIYMARHLASLDESQLSLSDATAITGLTANEISQTCRMGLLKPLLWKSSLYFRGADISRLLTSYLMVKRWSKIAGFRLSHVQASLAQEQFPALIDGSLYERTPVLEGWLDHTGDKKALVKDGTDVLGLEERKCIVGAWLASQD